MRKARGIERLLPQGDDRAHIVVGINASNWRHMRRVHLLANG